MAKNVGMEIKIVAMEKKLPFAANVKISSLGIECFSP